MRKLLAVRIAAAAGLILTGTVAAVPAGADVCVPGMVCVEDPTGLVDDVEQVARVGSFEPPNGDGSGGTPCMYVKHKAPAPAGWQAADNGPPYVFFRTIAWGDNNPAQWNERYCIFPIVVGPGGDLSDRIEQAAEDLLPVR